MPEWRAAEIEAPESVGAVRIVAARGVWLLHLGTSIWMLVGWALPWREALWAVVVWNPLVYLQWRLLDDRCILTIAEEKLRGPTFVQQAAVGEKGEDARCVAVFMSRVLGRPVPHWVADSISYSILWTSFSIAALRLWFGTEA